ncbi:hypothetical protein PHMEG_00019797 [Phytophthora megakarya]|uniref:RNase H type-1 domain-containing protein n=1 Tax=Phytophthora megakarya TaxID=4795 RepID=A0A225VQR2_9STRA|nr:hypothetical protein PHMEG_00019797 [Phytophthora megakarya]
MVAERVIPDVVDVGDSLRLVHVKREYNQAAHYITSKTLALGETWTVTDLTEMTHLECVASIPEKMM